MELKQQPQMSQKKGALIVLYPNDQMPGREEIAPPSAVIVEWEEMGRQPRKLRGGGILSWEALSS